MVGSRARAAGIDNFHDSQHTVNGRVCGRARILTARKGYELSVSPLIAPHVSPPRYDDGVALHVYCRKRHATPRFGDMAPSIRLDAFSIAMADETRAGWRMGSLNRFGISLQAAGSEAYGVTDARQKFLTFFAYSNFYYCLECIITGV
jgi:hypothetical protein